MKKYRSKTGLGIAFFLVVFLGAFAVVSFIHHRWDAFIVILLVGTFIVYMFRSTCYIITDKELIIKAGFIINEKIKISTIFRITESNDFFSAPAGSFDRLAVHYDKQKYAVISPKDKKGFTEHLLSLNPGIEVMTS